MKVSRRGFLKSLGIGAMGLTFSPAILKVLEAAASGNPPVLWIQGQGCTGCSVSLLNSVHPDIEEVLLDIISLKFHPSVMAGSGEMAMSAIDSAYKEGGYILILEGAIPTEEQGIYCKVGEETLLSLINRLSEKASALVAVGSCASYGGIPGGSPNPTGAKGLSDVVKKPVLNIPGCPAHPDWIIGSLVHVLMFGMPKLDENRRPLAFYGKTIHEQCQNYASFSKAEFAKKLSDSGCLIALGCKGPATFSDCPERHWNNGINWCIGAKAPCIGCVEPDFPDRLGPLYTHLPEELLPSGVKVVDGAIVKEVS